MNNEKPLWYRYRFRPQKPYGLVVFDGGKNSEKARIEAEKNFLDKVMDRNDTSESLRVIQGGLSNGELADSSHVQVILEEVGPKKLLRIKTIDTKAVRQKESKGHSGIINFLRRK